MSLLFEKIELGDRGRIESLLKSASGRGCEYTFSNLFIWSDIYETKVAFTEDDVCIVRYDSGSDTYLFPFGAGDIHRAVQLAVEDAENRGSAFRMLISNKEDAAFLEREFPNVFGIEQSRDFSEYVYESADLIELKGKKYHFIGLKFDIK